MPSARAEWLTPAAYGARSDLDPHRDPDRPRRAHREGARRTMPAAASATALRHWEGTGGKRLARPVLCLSPAPPWPGYRRLREYQRGLEARRALRGVCELPPSAKRNGRNLRRYRAIRARSPPGGKNGIAASTASISRSKVVASIEPCGHSSQPRLACVCRARAGAFRRPRPRRRPDDHAARIGDPMGCEGMVSGGGSHANVIDPEPAPRSVSD